MKRRRAVADPCAAGGDAPRSLATAPISRPETAAGTCGATVRASDYPIQVYATDHVAASSRGHMRARIGSALVDIGEAHSTTWSQG